MKKILSALVVMTLSSFSQVGNAQGYTEIDSVIEGNGLLKTKFHPTTISIENIDFELEISEACTRSMHSKMQCEDHPKRAESRTL